MNFRIDVDALMNRGYMSRILGGIALSIAMVLCLVFACGGSGDDGSDGGDTDEVIALEPSLGVLNPEFDAKTLSYTVNVGLTVESITFAPGTTSGGTVLVNDIEVESDVESPPILLRVGSNLATVVIHVGTVEETTYTIDVVRGAGLSAFLNASNPTLSDGFGGSIAIDGDTLVVGAPFEDSDATDINGAQNNDNAPGSGAVYVFTRDGDNWLQQAYIKASNTGGAKSLLEPGDQFGQSVAIDGDTLVVGAVNESSDATDINGKQDNDDAVGSGAVYVFTRDGDNWLQQAYIKASNTGGAKSFTEPGDQFGRSVAIDGDTLVVGAVNESSDATDINGAQDNEHAMGSGAVYVFTRDGDSWVQQAYIKASNTGNRDSFGRSVAIDGDTLVVGAVNESSNATDINGAQENDNAPGSGAVYVFTRDSDSWVQQAYIKASNTGNRDSFGGSVAIDGDTLVVGATGEDSIATGINGKQDNDNATDSGAVYVFTRDSDSWGQQAYIKASNTGNGDTFGGSVAIDGDSLVVGAVSEQSIATGINGKQDNNQADVGAAYMFTRDVDGWAQQAYIKASNASEGSFFGTSVAIDGVVVVGAEAGNTDSEETGAVYVY